jgi:hypothetical protein
MENQTQINFANAFKSFCIYFYNYRVDSLYRNVNGSHIGQFKRKKAYEILCNYTNLELKVETFKSFLLNLLNEIIKLDESVKKLFISKATLQLIKDFNELDFLFGNKQENKLEDNEKNQLSVFVDFSNSFYDDLEDFSNFPIGEVIPETQTNSNESISGEASNRAPSNLTLLVNDMNNTNDSHNTSSLLSALKDPSFIDFFNTFQDGLLNKLDVKIKDKIASEFDKHLGFNRELTSDQIEQYQLKFAETYNKILRKKNSIDILTTHLKNGTTPKSLCHQRFPPPHIDDDLIFCERVNNLIEKQQKERLELIITRHKEIVEILENDFNVYKGVLKYHIEKIDEFTEEVRKNEDKKLKGEFEKSLKKCLEAKKMPYTINKTKPKKSANQTGSNKDKTIQPKNSSKPLTNNSNSPKSNQKSTKDSQVNSIRPARQVSTRNISSSKPTPQRMQTNLNGNNRQQFNRKRTNYYWHTNYYQPNHHKHNQYYHNNNPIMPRNSNNNNNNVDHQSSGDFQVNNNNYLSPKYTYYHPFQKRGKMNFKN